MDRATPTQSLPKPGDLIAGKYRVDEAIREGGMGAVFSALHEVLGQRVAVKVLLAEAAKEEVSVARFLFEAHAAANLNSEHVASVMDAGTLTNGLPFFVMEYLEGADLGELLKLNGPLSVGELADYMLQALAGLAHAHAAEIIHRDLKPSNVFLALRPDGTNVIKILDFGISKSTNADASGKYKSLTGQQLLGSPAYMSPEQVRNSRSMDTRADIWSMGVVMYELLSGVIPFDGDGVGEILAAILDANPIPLIDRAPDVPKEFSDIVGKCLKKKPEDRYKNAAELAHAIAPFGTGVHDALVERTAQTLARPPMAVPTPLHAIRITASGPKYVAHDAPTMAEDGPSSVKLALARTERGRISATPPPPPERDDLEKTQPSRRRRRVGALLAGVAVIALASAALYVRASGFVSFSADTTAPALVAPPTQTAAPPPEVVPPIAPHAPAPTAAASFVAPTTSSAVIDPAPSASTSPHAAARPSTRPPTTSPKPVPTTGRPAILRSRD